MALKQDTGDSTNGDRWLYKWRQVALSEYNNHNVSPIPSSSVLAALCSFISLRQITTLAAFSRALSQDSKDVQLPCLGDAFDAADRDARQVHLDKRFLDGALAAAVTFDDRRFERQLAKLGDL